MTLGGIVSVTCSRAQDRQKATRSGKTGSGWASVAAVSSALAIGVSPRSSTGSSSWAPQERHSVIIGASFHAAGQDGGIDPGNRSVAKFLPLIVIDKTSRRQDFLSA